MAKESDIPQHLSCAAFPLNNHNGPIHKLCKTQCFTQLRQWHDKSRL